MLGRGTQDEREGAGDYEVGADIAFGIYCLLLY